VKRRLFLQGSLLAALFGSSGLYRLFAAQLNAEIKTGKVAVNPEATKLTELLKLDELPSHTVNVLRAEDLLNLQFQFFNLGLKSGKLQRLNTNKTAFIVVHFQPQHIYEQAFPKGAGKQPGPPPVATLLSGPSRLVFRMPSHLHAIPYTLESLLAWQQWDMNLAPVAAPVPMTGPLTSYQGIQQLQVVQTKPKVPDHLKGGSTTPEKNIAPSWPIAEPKPLATAIEAPYHLILSPHSKGGWVNSPGPEGKSGRIELWHTRLGVKTKQGVDTKDAALRKVRAIWSQEYSENPIPDPFCAKQQFIAAAGKGCPAIIPNDQRCSPMTQNDRRQIVELTSDHRQGAAKHVRPIQVNNLMLSTLGAWLDLRGDWDVEPGTLNLAKTRILDLESWVHRATMGRDHFVRLVYRGYLVPFGHRVSLIAVTEREIESQPIKAAYLRIQYFIIVREPVKHYSKAVTGTGNMDREGRRLPFRSVRIKTLITPMLDPVPGDSKANSWIMFNGGEHFQFHVEAEDWDGRVCEFSMPMRFAPAQVAEMPLDKTANNCQQPKSDGGTFKFFGGLSNLLGGSSDASPAGYNTTDSKLRTANLQGQRVGFVPNKTVNNTTQDTALETQAIRFAVDDRTAYAKGGELNFYPVMEQAAVEHAAAGQFCGKAVRLQFKYHDIYKSDGFANKNKGEVYAEMLTAVAMEYQNSRQVGGIVMPNMEITGLSRRFGTLAGKRLNEVASGVLQKDFFKDFFPKAKLIGGIDLFSIIANDFNDGKNIPVIKSETLNSPAGAVFRTIYEWKPKVSKSALFEPQGDVNDTLVIKAEFSKPPAKQGQGEFTIAGQLKNFKLILVPGFEFLHISFKSVSFISHNGEKPDFDVQLNGINFVGPLKYIQALEKNIPNDGFSDPPHLNVTASGVEVGYTMRLPDISAGAWGYHDLSLGAAMHLPFTGDPLSLYFNFASAEKPFTVTYNALGGDGYVELEAGPGGMRSLSAALAARAEVKVDFGPVAKGQGYFRIGVAFMIEETANGSSVTLTGFVATGGSVLAFGIAVISVGAMLSLEYSLSTGRATARGEITISVDTPIKDFSVSVPLEHTLSEGSGQQATAPDMTEQKLAGLYDEAYFQAYA